MARRSGRSSWSLVALLLSAGCSEGSTPLAEHKGTPSREQVAADEQVWITTGRDSLDLVEHVLGSPPPMRAVADAEPGAPVALLVPRSALEAISEAEHEHHHRCGGFVLHGSEHEALRAQSASMHGRSLNKAAPSYTVDNAATVLGLLSALREKNVLASIRQLSSYHSRFHTAPSSPDAVNWISNTWRAVAQSRPDIIVELVPHEGTPQPSVKMTMQGASLRDEIVVLGGHLDSVGGTPTRFSPDELSAIAELPAPGADDNAAGIAVITEVLRAAVELDYRPARTVVFYAYAAEEVGLVGSGEIAARAQKDKLNVVGVMQLDMTNFTAAPEPYITFVRDETDVALTAFSIELVDAYVHLPHRFRDCGYACSDHYAWTHFGFPSTFPNEAADSDRNPSAHTAEDTLAQTNDSVAHSMHFARLGAAFVAELAKGELGQPMGARDTSDARVSDASVDDASVDDASVDDASVDDASVDDASVGCAAAERCDSGSFAPPPSRDEPVTRDHGCSLSTVTGSRSASAAMLATLLILLVRRRRFRS